MFLEDEPKNISMSIYKNNPASRFCLRIVSHRDSSLSLTYTELNETLVSSITNEA